MGLPFGVSFLPGGDAQYQRGQDGSMGPGGVPVQQAIKILSMRVPRVVGQSPLAPLSLLTGPGGQGLPPGLLDNLLRKQMALAPAGGVPQAIVPPSLPSMAPSAAPSAMPAPPAIPAGVPPMAAPPAMGMASPVVPPPPMAPVISGAPSPQSQPAPPGVPAPSVPYTPKIHFQDPPVGPPSNPSPGPFGPQTPSPPGRENMAARAARDVREPAGTQGADLFPSPPTARPGPPGQQMQPSGGDTYTNQDQTDEQMRRILEMLLGGGEAQLQQ